MTLKYPATEPPDFQAHISTKKILLLTFFKEIYCTENIYSVYKGKLQNCSCNQFE